MAEQVDATSSSSLVEVTTIPRATAISRGANYDDFEVVVRVTAAGGEKMKTRAPIDLVAVLDVSGSMGYTASPEVKGTRLELLKKAMYFIIKKLSHDDHLALVSFNHAVVKDYSTELFPISGKGRGSAEETVKKLEPKGGTAFMPGLNRAVEILDGRGRDKKRLGFILLLTDGEDFGFKCTEPIDERYPVHTFGFCGADDARAMLYIAEQSHGTYSSVSGNITETFARCLGGLQSVVAFDTHIKLTCAAGVLINRIESGNYGNDISDGSTAGWIEVKQLYADEEKNFIVYLKVPMAAPQSSSSKLLAVGGTCKRAPGEKDDDIGRHDLSVGRPKEAVGVAVSAEVLQQIVRFRVIHFFVAFRVKYKNMRSVDMGMPCNDEEKQKERNKIKDEQAGAAKWLRKEWNEFKQRAENWSHDEKNLLLNGGIDKDVDAMVNNLNKGFGQTYVLSWLSSYQMQRAADGDTFLTPAMEHMAEEAKKPPEQVAPAEATVVPVPANVVPPAPKEETVPADHVAPPAQETVPEETPVVEDERARECAAFDTIELRLEYWYEVKRDLLLMFDDVEDDADEQPCHCGNHLSPVFHDESLRSINQAMYHDIYLAVEHASKLRRCYRQSRVKPEPEKKPQD